MRTHCDGPRLPSQMVLGLGADFRSWTLGSVSKEERHKYGCTPGPQCPPARSALLLSSSPTSLCFRKHLITLIILKALRFFFNWCPLIQFFSKIFKKLF